MNFHRRQFLHIAMGGARNQQDARDRHGRGVCVISWSHAARANCTLGELRSPIMDMISPGTEN
jgi:hypothetical protein